MLPADGLPVNFESSSDENLPLRESGLVTVGESKPIESGADTIAAYFDDK